MVSSGINTAISDAGKPWQNGTDQSFIAGPRDECLSMQWFRSRPEAKVSVRTTKKPASHLIHLCSTLSCSASA